MALRRLAVYFVVVQCLLAPGLSQQSDIESSRGAKLATALPKAQSDRDKPFLGAGRLRKEPAKLSGEIAESFGLPILCDSENDLYVRTAPDGIQALHELNSKGERIALFQAKSANVKVNAAGSFAIAPDGDLYQIIFAHEVTRYVFVYNRDGTVKSEIKLQPGFFFTPSKIAVFSNRDMLIAGLEYDKDRGQAMWPFTGIFAPDGTLRRELTLEDDQEIHDMAVSGDPKVTPPGATTVNYAVGRGEAQIGIDGNVYLMRRLHRAILYAISPGGSVRRFEVDPGGDDFMPESMHLSGDRIAVMFWQPQTHELLIRVVNLDGRPVATYYEPPAKEGEQPLGLGFACYTQNPERFTFVETTEDNRLGLVTAMP